LQDYIAEWQSPNFHQLHVQLALWMLIALIGVLGVSRKRLALSDFLLLAIFTYLALMAGRNIALFALVAALAMSRHLAPVMAEVGARLGFSGASSASPTRLQAWFNTAILAVVLLAAFVKVANDALPKTNTDAIAKILPVQAVDYIRQTKPPGRLFNSYNWGAYLLWDLPEYLVYVDGRTDLYNDEVIGEWLQVVRGQEGWQAILDKWDVHVILLEPAAALVGQLPYQGWREVYRDDLAVVYQRP
jgi:hypothetical protein